MAGDLLAIVMASSFAIATILVRRHPEIQMAPAAVLATALTALVALPLADPLGTAPRDLALLAFFGVGQFGVGFLLFMAGARLIPAAESSLIGMLETVLGPLWVWLALHERPDAASLAGGVLILAALLANAVGGALGGYATSAWATVGALPARVVRRMSRGWPSS